MHCCKAKGTKVYHLNIGQPDIETPKTALDALKNIDLKVLEYALSDGNLEYRKQLENITISWFYRFNYG